MTAFKKIFIVLFVTIIVAADSYSQYKSCVITIKNADSKKITAHVEIADNEDSRQRGLMFRRILDENEGMIFVFPSERKQNFWMKNTYIPLSIAYIGTNGIINEIYEMEPLDISVTYPSKKPAQYALEMKSGWFERNNIKTGCSINLNGCIGK